MKKLDQVIYCNNLYIYTSHGHEIGRASFIDILFTLLQNRNVFARIVGTEKIRSSTLNCTSQLKKTLSNEQIL